MPQDLAEDVRLLRTDINKLLEERSAVTSAIRNERPQLPNEQLQRPADQQQVKTERQLLLERLQELDNQDDHQSPEPSVLNQLPSRLAANNES